MLTASRTCGGCPQFPPDDERAAAEVRPPRCPARVGMRMVTPVDAAWRARARDDGQVSGLPLSRVAPAVPAHDGAALATDVSVECSEVP